jgi:hypothetical protein
MANKTVTVKPTGGTYATLAAAIAGEVAANANLVTMAGILTISIEGDWSSTIDTASVNINGFTTNSTYYLKITTDAANRALKTGWTTARYNLHPATPAVFAAIDVNDVNVWIDGLQVTCSASGGAIITNTTPNLCYISNCYLVAINTQPVLYSYHCNTVIWNSVLTGGRWGIVVEVGDCKAYNCTIYGNVNDGVNFTSSSNGTGTFKNCAVFAHDDDFNTAGTSGSVTIDYCASDDNDGTHNVAESGGGAAWPSDFTAAATGNFTILGTSNLVGAGTDDPGAGLYSTDIDGVARSSTWDVGADEYATASTPVSVSGDLRQAIALQKAPAISAIQSLFTQRKHVKMIF